MNIGSVNGLEEKKHQAFKWFNNNIFHRLYASLGWNEIKFMVQIPLCIIAMKF